MSDAQNNMNATGLRSAFQAGIETGKYAVRNGGFAEDAHVIEADLIRASLDLVASGAFQKNIAARAFIIDIARSLGADARTTEERTLALEEAIAFVNDTVPKSPATQELLAQRREFVK